MKHKLANVFMLIKLLINTFIFLENTINFSKSQLCLIVLATVNTIRSIKGMGNI